MTAAIYWLVVNAAMTIANTFVAVRDNTSTSWLMFTISLALTLFCVGRFITEVR